MTIPNTGLGAYTTECAGINANGQAGTGTTAPTESDTALETPVVATLSALSVTEGTRSFQTSHFTGSTVATGNDFTEWSNETSGSVLLSRAVTASVSHTANDEITKITTVNLVNK